MKKENPDLAFGEVGKRLGELWKEVTASEKAKFEDMAKKDKVYRSTAVIYADWTHNFIVACFLRHLYTPSVWPVCIEQQSAVW